MGPRMTSGLAVCLALAAVAGVAVLGRPQLPEAPGRTHVELLCGTCHSAVRAASVRLTAEGWQWVIDEMRRRGAPGTDADFAVAYDYLTTHFLGEGARPLNINTGSRVDLEAVAGLTRRESAAVVAWRETHGLCTALDDLRDVPGLDFSKIEDRRDSLVCYEPILLPTTTPADGVAETP